MKGICVSEAIARDRDIFHAKGAANLLLTHEPSTPTRLRRAMHSGERVTLQAGAQASATKHAHTHPAHTHTHTPRPYCILALPSQHPPLHMCCYTETALHAVCVAYAFARASVRRVSGTEEHARVLSQQRHPEESTTKWHRDNEHTRRTTPRCSMA